MERNLEALFSPEEIMRREQLFLLKEQLAAGPYPGYPEQHLRLFQNLAYCIDEYNRINLPNGTWVVDSHPNQPTPERWPDLDTTLQLQEAGHKIDAHGRPLHPWFTDMMQDPDIRIVLGKGVYWNWGPNYTADNIVLCQDHVLLIKRKDTGLWALPGGHVDEHEIDTSAAVRELAEETGLVMTSDVVAEEIYRGPVVDPRLTGHAWPETTAVRYRLNQELPEVVGYDDADEAAWVPVEVALQAGNLFGAHDFLLRRALL